MDRWEKNFVEKQVLNFPAGTLYISVQTCLEKEKREVYNLQIALLKLEHHEAIEWVCYCCFVKV